MLPKARSVAIVALLSAGVALFYATRLQFSPVYLMHDEMQFALQAQAIASTGHDLHGRWLPLYFTEPEFPAGRDPVIIYATALVLKVLPLSESSVRLATSLVGVLNVVVMFLVGRRVFGTNALGLVAAILLALTPAHFIRSRMALSPLYSIPFILAWLLWLARFVDKPERRTLAVAVAWLSLGLYTYLACMVMMPMYLVMTAMVAVRHRVLNWVGPVLWCSLIPLVPMVAWLVAHPERYTQVVEAYRLYSVQAGPDTGMTGSALSETVRLRLGLFWSFFNPEFLFMSGDSSLVNSTRRIGFFPMAFIALIPLGIYRLARHRGSIGAVIIAGLITAPAASIASGAIEMNRIMFVIPFAVLTAVAGAHALATSRRPAWRAAGAVLLLTVPIQFSGFYADYMGPYRAESSSWLGGNLRDAFTDVIRRAGPGTRPVYVSREIPFALRYWRFYALAENRGDMVERVVVYDPSTFDAASLDPGSHLVCPAQGGCERQVASALWARVSVATEPDGSESFAVYERR